MLGGAKRLQFGEERLAFLIGVAEQVHVVEIFSPLHEMKTGDRLKQRTDGDSKEAVLLSVTKLR